MSVAAAELRHAVRAFREHLKIAFPETPDIEAVFHSCVGEMGLAEAGRLLIEGRPEWFGPSPGLPQRHAAAVAGVRAFALLMGEPAPDLPPLTETGPERPAVAVTQASAAAVEAPDPRGGTPGSEEPQVATPSTTAQNAGPGTSTATGYPLAPEMMTVPMMVPTPNGWVQVVHAYGHGGMPGLAPIPHADPGAAARAEEEDLVAEIVAAAEDVQAVEISVEEITAAQREAQRTYSFLRALDAVESAEEEVCADAMEAFASYYAEPHAAMQAYRKAMDDHGPAEASRMLDRNPEQFGTPIPPRARR